ncbi:MAG: alpha/beta hydrolase [Magnetococcales bacterium]|nr:alpha/beta hydrolase [Magnetococcales bacterium]
MAQHTHQIFFAHGKSGTPWGSKIQRLADLAKERGFEVESLDYQGITSPDDRVQKLLDRAPAPSGQLLLVGSSMGAYLSIVASEKLRPDGLFLLAPAIYKRGYAIQDPVPHSPLTVAVHGYGDEVIPVADAIRFAQKHKIRLHLVDSGHRLLDAMPFIEKAFGWFLDEAMKRGED